MCIGKAEIWQTSSILFTVNVISIYFDELLNMHKLTDIITVHLTTKSKCYIIENDPILWSDIHWVEAFTREFDWRRPIGLGPTHVY